MDPSKSGLFSFSKDDLVAVHDDAASKYRILVVEDDLDVAGQILTSLARAGMECRHTTDGEVCLEALRSNDFHLLLLDLTLPRQDSQEICRKARKFSTVPLIVLMEQDEHDAQMKCFGVGADDYQLKPISFQLLALRVVSLLRRSYVYNRRKHKLKVPFSSLPLAHSIQSTMPTNFVIPSAPPPTPPVDEATEKGPTLPAGWSRCDICDYMGPTPRFQTEDANGRKIMACPHCGDTSSIDYTLG
jgi:CheY-like chemotaxis protein